MKILHISAECYPAAKAGGLGDVVGALPKYLNHGGHETAVVIPKHATKWMYGQSFKEVMRGTVRLGWYHAPYIIEECMNFSLGFPLYVVNAPQYFNRSGIYTESNGEGYGDDVLRWLTFQQAVIHWVLGMERQPDVLHCHDHHTGLIPFMVKYCPEYSDLKDIPTVFTIHNGQYQGAFSWRTAQELPYFDAAAAGLLEWTGMINPMASAIKCCWAFTTVSPGYMDELRHNSGGLEWLINNEAPKSRGILNGIDTEVWDPRTDEMLAWRLGDSMSDYKKANKHAICQRFQIREDLPLFTFIGRLVGEKGADLLPGMIGQFLYEGAQACFVVLGTGEVSISEACLSMKRHFTGYFDTFIGYNEALAHQLYAGSDFLLMPSRVEPCGLNQMYAQRYGTVPVVRAVGGLRDTVVDISNEQSSGIRFDGMTIEEAKYSLYRALALYHEPNRMYDIRRRMMSIDHSWEKSAEEYIGIYEAINKSR